MQHLIDVQYILHIMCDTVPAKPPAMIMRQGAGLASWFTKTSYISMYKPNVGPSLGM